MDPAELAGREVQAAEERRGLGRASRPRQAFSTVSGCSQISLSM